ncbi:MAG: orotidine-5'-phosphate decarboxylase [Acidimicrobiia bacterium]
MNERRDGGARDPDARAHLALALDVGNLRDAIDMATRLQPWFGIAKVGMELYAEAGPAAFEVLQDKGFRVFADVKLYDIPNTLRRSARVFGRHGVEFLNFPAAVGLDSLCAGVEGFKEGAHDAGHAVAIALGVTVLTSDPDTSALASRMQVARDAGCDGVVCAGTDVAQARELGLQTMVPGIRPAGVDANEQARVDTPGDAIARGADWLVIGRAVTAATDPERAAAAIVDEVAGALSSR